MKRQCPKKLTFHSALSTVLLSGAIILGLGTINTSEADVLCLASNGKVNLRKKCKRGERRLTQSVLQGPPGRGVNEALAGGSGVRGVGGGVFTAPGANSDPWVVVESFNAVLPTPLTSDKVIIAQHKLREFCNDVSNTLPDATNNKLNDCLRTTDALDGVSPTASNQREKAGQFVANEIHNLCDGSAEVPTAPAGYVCIYLVEAKDFDLLAADTVPTGTGSAGFNVTWISTGSGGVKSKINFVWAYTAPEL